MIDYQKTSQITNPKSSRMKKFFTLVAVAAMALTASAQDATETWTPADPISDTNVVTLPSITAEFLDNTSKGSTADQGSWTNNGSDMRGDQNGLEIKFTPSKNGELKIVFAAAVASKKSINMFVNGDPANTMDATYNGQTITAGVNIGDQGISEIPADEFVTYNLTAGNYYNYYTGGTKWRLRSFSFTPSGDSALENIAVEENAPVVYYNLQGAKVANPSNGLYIRVQGNKAEKVVL